MTEYGSGGNFTVRMDGPYAGGGGGAEGGGSLVKLATISALASAWKGGTSPYSQDIHVDGISVNSVVEINLNTDQIEQIRSENKNIAFTTVNVGGVVTLIAIGSKPSKDLVFQAKIVDVLVVGNNTELLGNTITIHQESLPIIGGTMKGAVNMGSNTLTGLPAPVNETDAARKADLEKRLSLSGGTMTGDINMNGKSISNVKDPVQNKDAVHKKYVDDAKAAANKYTDEKHQTFTVTLTANGWTIGDGGAYYQTIAVEGILETDNPHWGIVYSHDERFLAEKDAFGLVDMLVTVKDSLIFVCIEGRPEADMTIQLEVNR